MTADHGVIAGEAQKVWTSDRVAANTYRELLTEFVAGACAAVANPWGGHGRMACIRCGEPEGHTKHDAANDGCLVYRAEGALATRLPKTPPNVSKEAAPPSEEVGEARQQALHNAQDMLVQMLATPFHDLSTVTAKAYAAQAWIAYAEALR